MSEYLDRINQIRSRFKVQGESDLEATQEPTINRLDAIQDIRSRFGTSEPEDITSGTYSEKNLVEDKFFYPIKDYMVDRYGSHYETKGDRKEIINEFLNTRRGVAGGNSVRAVAEYSYLNEISGDEAKMARAGKAYEIYENMQGLFGETTFGEKAGIVGDFARSAILDPTNLIGLGLGKAVTSSGFKAGSMAATIMAKQAYKKELAKGVTKEAAEKVALGVFKAQKDIVQKSVQKKMLRRAALERATRGSVAKKVFNKQTMKEIGIVGGFEGAVAAGTDYLYQDSLLRTRVQEDYSYLQTGLSSVAGIVVLGTIAAASKGGAAGLSKGLGGFADPNRVPIKTTTKGAKIGDLSESIKKYIDELDSKKPDPKVPPVGKWMEDTAKGKELTDQDTEFFITMLLGNDDIGLKGLGQILLEQNYGWVARSEDDKISNWIGDIIKQADPQDAKKFLTDFSKATGITMNEGKKLTVEGFANTFKRKMRDSMRVGNAASQLAKKLGKKESEVNVEDYVTEILTGHLPPPTSTLTTKASSAAGKAGKAVGDLVENELPAFQNNLIRLMVSNLSTTALNVGGYAGATTLTSASEVARAALLGGRAGLTLVYNPSRAKQLGLEAKGIFANQSVKLRNTLDVNTTYDKFLEYVQQRPKATAELSRVLPGGVEDIKKLADGMDLKRSMLSLRQEQGIDFIQKLNLVQAQDSYTKSIEFVTQLDSALRLPKEKGGFGMSWNEFFNRDDYRVLMGSERFVKAEAKAVNETLKSVFSKSYKGKGAIGEVAGIIEDFRNIPGIGILVPFGRFFNNTVAFTAENTAVLPLLAKMGGRGGDRSVGEIMARGAVTASVIGYLAQRENEFIDLGLSWSEELDENGAVIDEKYEFPYGIFKAAARVVALHQRGEEVPKELVTQISDQFIGQLTRQLGEAGEGVDGLITALISDEGRGVAISLGKIASAMTSQAVSAGTRFVDPVNQLVGLIRKEEYLVPDRKQNAKLMNDSLRYMDQIIGSTLGDMAPEKFSPTEGRLRGQETKVISTTRETKLTAAERMYNMISKPTYLAGSYTDAPEADNRYNQLFNQVLNMKARELLKKDKFINGTLEQRRLLISEVEKSSKNAVKSFMKSLASQAGDSDLVTMIEIADSGKGKRKVQKTLERLGIDKKINELTSEELDLVKSALKFYDDITVQ